MLVANSFYSPEDSCEPGDSGPSPAPVAPEPTPIPVTVNQAEAESLAVEFLAGYYTMLPDAGAFDIESLVGLGLGDDLAAEVREIHRQFVEGGFGVPGSVQLDVVDGRTELVVRHPDPTFLVRVCVQPVAGSPGAPAGEAYPILVNVTSVEPMVVTRYTTAEGFPCQVGP